MNSINIVLDTNVIISGIIFGGKPRELIELIIEGKYILYLSENIIEVLGILEIKFNYSKDKLAFIENELKAISEICYPDIKLNIVKDDPDDNKIIECAIESDSKYIISGDHHLLDLGKYKNIKIIKVSEFIEMIK